MTTPAVEIRGYIAGTWDIDPVHSHIGFVARHLMVSKVRGRFDTFEAQIVTAEDPLQSSGTATVDLNSVNTGNQTRDDDLRSGNFFDAATHPAMAYRSTGIRRDGEDFIMTASIGGPLRPGGGGRAAVLARRRRSRLQQDVAWPYAVKSIVGLLLV